MRRRGGRGRLATGLLAALCLLLALGLVRELAAGDPAGPVGVLQAAAPVAGEPAPADLAAHPDPARDRAILDRPLFNPSRRPIVEPAAPAAEAQAPPPPPPPPPPPLPPLVLVGIVIQPHQRIALLGQPGSPALIRVGEGGDLAGWRVERILLDRVLLQTGETHEAIAFPKAAQNRIPPAPPAP